MSLPVRPLAVAAVVCSLLSAGTGAAADERPWLATQDPDVNLSEVAEASARPDQLHDGWQVSTLEAEGVNAIPIAVLLKRIRIGHYVDINGLVLVRNGKLLSEAYFGTYESRTPGKIKQYNREVLHETRSSFKSVTGLLAGIAIEEGLVKLDEPVMPLIADYHILEKADPRKQRMTIRHLLEMASGFDCSEMPGASPSRESQLLNKTNMVRSHAELAMADEPGATWRYCSTNPMLFGFALEAVLKRRGGGPLKDYIDIRLMAQLDISRYHTGFSPKGLMFLHGGQKMRPRDMAKFGQLVVSGGLWRGKQVVPARWIDAIRSPGRPTRWSWTDSVSSAPEMRRQSRYQYQWFQTLMPHRTGDVVLYHSWGNGGQFVIAIPDLDLVVTTTAANYGAKRVEKQKQIFHMLHKYILPAVR